MLSQYSLLSDKQRRKQNEADSITREMHEALNPLFEEEARKMRENLLTGGVNSEKIEESISRIRMEAEATWLISYKEECKKLKKELRAQMALNVSTSP